MQQYDKYYDPNTGRYYTREQIEAWQRQQQAQQQQQGQPGAPSTGDQVAGTAGQLAGSAAGYYAQQGLSGLMSSSAGTAPQIVGANMISSGGAAGAGSVGAAGAGASAGAGGAAGAGTVQLMQPAANTLAGAGTAGAGGTAATSGYWINPYAAAFAVGMMLLNKHGEKYIGEPVISGMDKITGTKRAQPVTNESFVTAKENFSKQLPWFDSLPPEKQDEMMLAARAALMTRGGRNNDPNVDFSALQQEKQAAAAADPKLQRGAESSWGKAANEGQGTLNPGPSFAVNPTWGVRQGAYRSLGGKTDSRHTSRSHYMGEELLKYGVQPQYVPEGGDGRGNKPGELDFYMMWQNLPLEKQLAINKAQGGAGAPTNPYHEQSMGQWDSLLKHYNPEGKGVEAAQQVSPTGGQMNPWDNYASQAIQEKTGGSPNPGWGAMMEKGNQLPQQVSPTLEGRYDPSQAGPRTAQTLVGYPGLSPQEQAERNRLPMATGGTLAEILAGFGYPNFQPSTTGVAQNLAAKAAVPQAYPSQIDPSTLNPDMSGSRTPTALPQWMTNGGAYQPTQQPQQEQPWMDAAKQAVMQHYANNQPSRMGG